MEAIQCRVGDRPDGCYARLHITRHDAVQTQDDDQNTSSLRRTKPIMTRGCTYVSGGDPDPTFRLSFDQRRRRRYGETFDLMHLLTKVHKAKLQSKITMRALEAEKMWQP